MSAERCSACGAVGLPGADLHDDEDSPGEFWCASCCPWCRQELVEQQKADDRAAAAAEARDEMRYRDE